MKTLNMTFNEKTFNELKTSKNLLRKILKLKKFSWENFLIYCSLQWKK